MNKTHQIVSIASGQKKPRGSSDLHTILTSHRVFAKSARWTPLTFLGENAQVNKIFAYVKHALIL